MVKGNNLNVDEVRAAVEAKGDSVVVVGDSTTVKIHVHTPHPGIILEFGTSLGSLHDLKIENMDDQHEGFLQVRRDRGPTRPGCPRTAPGGSSRHSSPFGKQPRKPKFGNPPVSGSTPPGAARVG